jgi:hypothetical protein
MPPKPSTTTQAAKRKANATGKATAKKAKMRACTVKKMNALTKGAKSKGK